MTCWLKVRRRHCTWMTFRRLSTCLDIQHEAEPKQVCLRSFIGEVPWIHGLTEGVEANPDKIRAILSMEPPQNVKEVQSLTRWVTSLNRFVSKATDKCLPFFKVLKESIRMDGRVSKSIWRPQGISHNNSLAEPIQAKWRTIPLLSSLSSRSKFCLSQRRREGT